MTRMAHQAARMAATNARSKRSAATMPLQDLSAAPQFPPAVPVRRTLNITVLSGGPGSEREVSLKSGQAVAAALRAAGQRVEIADISPADLTALDLPADLVFIALHGTFGEDGRLQRILDQRGICYCGSGPAASALAMDKVAAKSRFIEAGIPTPRFDRVIPGRLAHVLRLWTPPVVLKPVAEGSSVDCFLAHDATVLREGLDHLLSQHGACLIEEYIVGLELTVGVLGDEALPPIQIRTRRSFYDYQAKYVDNDTQYLFDIDLPVEVIDRIKRLSLEAHRALGCQDFSRVDWMVDGRTFEPFALEVNTIPGFTDHSLLPKAAARAGLDFSQLCQRIVELACRRHDSGG